MTLPLYIKINGTPFPLIELTLNHVYDPVFINIDIDFSILLFHSRGAKKSGVCRLPQTSHIYNYVKYMQRVYHQQVFVPMHHTIKKQSIPI